MARYLHYFQSQEAFETTYNSGYYEEPWVSFVGDSGKTVSFDRQTHYEVLKKKPLTFEILEDGFIYIYYDGQDDSYTKEIAYSINGGERIRDEATPDYTIEIEVSTGDKVQFFGNSDFMSIIDGSSYEYYTYFGSNCKFRVKGNVMSLLDADDFENMVNFPDDSLVGIFSHLFNECDGLVDAYDLILPVEELATRSYTYMFSNCINLIAGPEILPATTLAEYCYSDMFNGCTSLTTSPELPATTLVNYCYGGMFYGCTSLATAPALPATTLAEGCYASMFYGCTSLATVPALPATMLANHCYHSMFDGCTSLTAAPVLPATTLVNYCYAGMFDGCTSLATAPALPATMLAAGCYTSMFQECTRLTAAPALPATTLAASCYSNMFWDCTSLNYIKCLATDISASNCTADWVYNVASTGTFVKATSMAGWPRGISGIPNNWLIEEE